MRPIRGSISLPSFAPKFQSSLLGFFLVVGERCVGFVMTTLSLAAPFAFAHMSSTSLIIVEEKKCFSMRLVEAERIFKSF
ncbi:hypothetical protein GLYMA_08G171200v4 [Glycine max]|uniref:Uncharacterized protein n=1 Tax=Glycine max TaxID=3847 RepID=A0A0R0IN94_SOYBN|nr:hypothetical protein GYH30_021522 [Glycine max]KRH43774.1 hypothetical protein GLYMA_08G171200v4 [Glycine max]